MVKSSCAEFVHYNNPTKTYGITVYIHDIHDIRMFPWLYPYVSYRYTHLIICFYYMYYYYE